MSAIRRQSRLLIYACLFVISGFLFVAHQLYYNEQPSTRFQRDVLEREMQLQADRRASIRNACRLLSQEQHQLVPISNQSEPMASRETQQLLTSLIPYLDHFIVDDAHKLIYCYVPKVASTNWKRVLMALSSQRRINANPLQILGNETNHNQFKLLSQETDVDVLYHKLRTYMKFLFVRHPYERLLSAYRNKFEIAWNDYFRTRFGRKIIRQFRHNASQESLERGHDVTFSEFLQYVLNLSTSDHKIEFNEHWRPINDLCHPCYVSYNVIGKTETLVDDADYVLYQLGVLDFVRFPRRDETYNSVPSWTLLNQYFSEIDQQTVADLAELYSKDFQLFQYDSGL